MPTHGQAWLSENSVILKPIEEVFPYLVARSRTPQLIFQRLTQVRYFRNRVFHHEPIWHWPNLMQKYQEIKEILDWLTPQLKEPLSKLDRFKKVYAEGSNAYLIDSSHDAR